MKEYLLRQIERYPGMQVEDAVKLLYQSEFGGGHMIKNPQASLKRIKEEWERIKEQKPADCKEETVRMQSQKIPDCEEIGGGMCRMNLKILEKGFSPETLNQIFVRTAERKVGTVSSFEKKLDMLKECGEKGEVPFSGEEMERYLEDYRKQGYPPVSHSQAYRRLYHPAYRVAAEYYTRYYDVFLSIDRLCAEAGDRQVLVAVDGMCGSGKSTLGKILKEIYGCRLFHMDDFFLRPCQRTKERLAQPGGNVDYERFKEEILDHIGEKQGLKYRPYDCGTQTLGQPVKEPYHTLNILEGVYSQHPCFGNIYDLRIFCQIEKEEQERRILKRNGKEMLKRFQEQWIPMENLYFETFHIARKSMVIK